MEDETCQIWPYVKDDYLYTPDEQDRFDMGHIIEFKVHRISPNSSYFIYDDKCNSKEKIEMEKERIIDVIIDDMEQSVNQRSKGILIEEIIRNSVAFGIIKYDQLEDSDPHNYIVMDQMKHECWLISAHEYIPKGVYDSVDDKPKFTVYRINPSTKENYIRQIDHSKNITIYVNGLTKSWSKNDIPLKVRDVIRMSGKIPVESFYVINGNGDYWINPDDDVPFYSNIDLHVIPIPKSKNI